MLDQAIPDGWVEDSISGKAEVIIKSQFGDTGFSISDSILSLFVELSVSSLMLPMSVQYSVGSVPTHFRTCSHWVACICRDDTKVKSK